MLKVQCPHCSTRVSSKVRKVLLWHGEARCPWCGYMLVPRITSLWALKIGLSMLLASAVNVPLKYFFSDMPHFLILLATIFAAFAGIRLCDCFSELRAFDV